MIQSPFRDQLSHLLNGIIRISGAVSVISVLLLGVTFSNRVSSDVADAAVAASLIAVFVGLAWVTWIRNDQHFRCFRATTRTENVASGYDYKSPLLFVLLVSSVSVQSWFRQGTVVAGGDISPPSGTAWLSHLFSPWVWTGQNFGGPGTLELRSSSAAVLYLVHLAGGSPGLAQRLLLTTLFVGAGIACFTLLKFMRVAPWPAAIGSLVYLFSAYTISVTGALTSYLAAMVLLPLLPAAIIAAGSGSWTVRKSVLVMGLLAPLLGTCYENPPLVGMIVLAALLSVPMSLWLFGRGALVTSSKATVFGFLALLSTSAYWLVPSLFSLSSLSVGNLSSLGSWAWTEGRATLKNALWLNTTWSWRDLEYLPFTQDYSRFPFVILKFFVPALSLAAIPLTAKATSERDHFRRIALASGLVALALIVFSTGTRMPGRILFLPAYRLPHGWLLQDPGRFLMLACLAFAIMCAVSVQMLASELPRLIRRWKVTRFWDPNITVFGATTLVAGMIMMNGFPLITGAVVPSSRPTLPSMHVTVPTYWIQMASFLNRSGDSGNLLLLPPDDFYQMPYTWGYYGTDGFITDMISRNVVDPSGQGYYSASSTLLSDVRQTASSILTHNWKESATLARALNTPLVLVRQDINAAFPKRSIMSPATLADSLLKDPYFKLVHSNGPLLLFQLRQVVGPKQNNYVTENTRSPDLSVLDLFPLGTQVVSGPQQLGVPAVLPIPPLSEWKLTDSKLSIELPEQTGWKYSSPLTIDGVKSSASAAISQVVEKTNFGSLAKFSVVVPRTGNLLSNSQFRQGPWQAKVGNCYILPNATPNIAANILADGGPTNLPALELSAVIDSACEAQALSWSKGPVLLSFWVKHVSGNPPRVCIWEVGPDRCAVLQPLSQSRDGWQHYQRLIVPDSGTSSLSLFLYSDAISGGPTINEYADFKAVNVPELPPLAIVATPKVVAPDFKVLMTNGDTYSRLWQGPPGSQHVLVNGMTNGWIVHAARGPKETYRPAIVEKSASVFSLAAGLGIVVLMAVDRWKLRKLNHSEKVRHS